ncbi:MAG: DUF2971 domain-containing protein [Pseudomonadota bacterium]|nr:DUF2971 domain-containing protein [Pseudomonadota bacterium]
MRIYYLSPSQFAISNLALRRLKIARISDLNDPFELLAMIVRNEEDLRVFSMLKDRLSKDNGLLCFSRSWENPVLWGHYADRHTGIALGFDVDDAQIQPVNYAKEPFAVTRDPITDLPSPTENEMSTVLCTKFYDWKYEDEVRVFVQLDHATKEGGLYFYPFDEKVVLREVVLGPKCELPLKAIRALVSEYTPTVEVIKSSIALGTFRVVKNELASRAGI